MRTEFLEDFNKRLKKYEGILGSIMIGSEATGYASEASDIDVHVIVDQTKNRTSFSYVYEGRDVNVNVYPLDRVLQRIRSESSRGSRRCKRMYGTQGLILDDPYGIIDNIKKQSTNTMIDTAIDIQFLGFTIGGFSEYQEKIAELDNYARYNLMYRVFSEYSYSIGYDHYSNFDITFWKHSSRIFHDDDYAENHRGKIYDDKKFILMREDCFSSGCEDASMKKMLFYATESLKKLL